MVDSISKHLNEMEDLDLDVSFPPKGGGLKAHVRFKEKKMTLRILRFRGVTGVRAVETRKYLARQDGYTMKELETFCKNNMV